MRIILLSVTSFDETFYLLIGAQLKRAQHSARDSGHAVIRGALPWLRHAGAFSSKLRTRITGSLPALPAPAKPANDPAPDEPAAAKKARETAEEARRAARGNTEAAAEKSDKAQSEQAGAKQG
jgi:hypothetical protein